MERLLAIWIPSLSSESDDGAVTTRHAALLADLTLFCPFTELVRYGLFVLPTRGPSRFLGGEHVVLESVRELVRRHAGEDPCLGVADGLFAATAAARRELVTSPGETAAFRASLPIESLDRPAFSATAHRLGLHRVGDFARLSRAHVTERFSADVVRAHDVACGRRDVWDEYRDPVLFRRLREIRGEEEPVVGQLGFFGERTEADRRALAAAHRVSVRLGVEGVWTVRLRGGRTPADRVAWRPFGAPAWRETTTQEPWPGRLPSPSPALVFGHPVVVALEGARGEPVRVTGRGLLSAPPARLGFTPRTWHEIAFVAGPWPHEEGWWATRRRRAHLQVLLHDERAVWLFAEQGRWYLAGMYD